MANLAYSVGRDKERSTRFEFCIFRGDELFARKGGFKSTRSARMAAASFIAATYLEA